MLTPLIDPKRSTQKKSRNDLVQCSACGLELLRKKLKKHRRSAHSSLSKLMILEKTGKKSPVIRACTNCGVQSEDAWIFERSTRGPVAICSKCKPKLLKISFSAKAIEARRLASLKVTLKELKDRKAKLPVATIDKDLINNIYEVEESIKRGPQMPKRGSPILPGSFGSGKRR